jgi:hypothetical protein
VQKTLIVGVPGSGDLELAFPLDVPMVPSPVITVAADDGCLTCGGFSLSEIICLGSFEFITNYIDGLSRSLGGVTQVPSSWAQLTTGDHPCGGP